MYNEKNIRKSTHPLNCERREKLFTMSDFWIFRAYTVFALKKYTIEKFCRGNFTHTIASYFMLKPNHNIRKYLAKRNENPFSYNKMYQKYRKYSTQIQ